jgi:hypothetical protein
MTAGGYGNPDRLTAYRSCVCDIGNTTVVPTATGDECQCQSGFITNTSMITGEPICIECGRNEWSSGLNSTICQSCPMYSSTKDRTGQVFSGCECDNGYGFNNQTISCDVIPQTCGISYYFDISSASGPECVRCPNNSTTLSTGSVSILNCSCVAGYYLNTSSSSYCNGSYSFPSTIDKHTNSITTLSLIDWICWFGDCDE